MNFDIESVLGAGNAAVNHVLSGILKRICADIQIH